VGNILWSLLKDRDKNVPASDGCFLCYRWWRKGRAQIWRELVFWVVQLEGW